MYPFYLELELVKPVSDYFKKKGYKVKHEVKIGYCRADLVAFKKKEVVAVELKLRDWKKALIQMKNYQLACEYVYLAVPLSKVYTILRKAEHLLKKEGIGLLIVNDKTNKVCTIIHAQKSQKQLGKLTLEAINQNNRKNHQHKRL